METVLVLFELKIKDFVCRVCIIDFLSLSISFYSRFSFLSHFLHLLSLADWTTNTATSWNSTAYIYRSVKYALGYQTARWALLNLISTQTNKNCEGSKACWDSEREHVRFNQTRGATDHMKEQGWTGRTGWVYLSCNGHTSCYSISIHRHRHRLRHRSIIEQLVFVPTSSNSGW